MKIVIASGIYPPDIGGPATYSQTIAREFSKEGIDVSVICYTSEAIRHQTFQTSPAFKIIRISRKQNVFIRYLSYFWNLFKLAKNCDVIYAQGPLSAGLPARIVSKILRKKFVIKIVGDYAWEQYQNKSQASMPNTQLDLIDAFQNKKYDWKTELRRKIQTFVCQRADKIIVPSEYLKKIVIGWGIDEKKIEVIYNSFDSRGYTQNQFASQNTQINADISASIGVSPKADNQRVSADVIISAGRPEPWKGFDTLKEIMPDLLKENPKFRLIIATNLPHDELMANFKASMMFVLNTGYEGLPHIILEAMACGLPVITTNVCGNPEVVQNEYNGLLVEYNDKEQLKNAILRLWKDANLRNKFIENGYKTLEKFKLEDMIKKTITVLFESFG